MNYKEQAIDIIGDVFEAMTFPVNIVGYQNNGGGLHTLTMDNMYHAQPGFVVSIGGKNYTIQDIIPSEQPDCEDPTDDVMTVKGTAANITATTFNMYSPYYFHGTPIAQGVELSKISQAKNKTPMGWFYEQFSERFIESETDAVERELRFRLFCLTQGNPDKWVTDDAYKYAIKPMRRLAERFIDSLKLKQWRFNVDTLEYDILNYAKFGVFISNRGMDRKLWHDNLAGVEISATVMIFKVGPC